MFYEFAFVRNDNHGCCYASVARGADLEERKKERAPEFLTNFGDTLALEGMDCRLALSYVGYPQPDITWLFNGRHISTPSDVYDTLAIGDEARLVIRAATRDLAGEHS